MVALILVERTWPGDAYRYTRYEGRESTHVVETEPAPVGVRPTAIPPDLVEEMRAAPERFFKEAP
jgi:hypothetical protein